MPHECRIEFYFKAEEMAKLLADNPTAKGIIISQQIVREKPKGADHYVNVTRIKARPDLGENGQNTSTTELRTSVTAGEETINGCPYPPGCTE